MKDDIIYFIENYVLSNGSHIKLNKIQKQFINYLYNTNGINKINIKKRSV